MFGGTGLYIESLIYGIEFEDEKIDEEYRRSLNKVADEEGLEALYEMAQKIDKIATLKISPNDKKRIIRILEIYYKTGKTKTEQDIKSREKEIKYDYLLFAINFDREKLYTRINERVDIMIEAGLINEVEEIIKKHKRLPTALQGIGYKEVVEYLNGNVKKEEMIEKIKMETRRYAKRQLTWFRKYKDIVWLDGEEEISKNVDTIINYKRLREG